MTLQLKDFSPENNYLKVLLYGDSGTGKTVFGAKAKDSLILCVENGLSGIDKVIDSPEFKICEINKFDQLREAYELLNNGTWKFQTVVIDSISKMDNFLQAEIRGRKETMTQQERGIFGRRMQGLIDAFMKLPMNIIIIAEEDSDKDAEGVIKIYPKVSGQTGKRLSYNFDIVGHTYKTVNDKGEVQYKVNVEYDPLAVTKCRGGFITNDTPNDFNEWIKLATAGAKTPTKESKVETFTANDFETLFRKSGLDEKYKDNANKSYSELKMYEGERNGLLTKSVSIKTDIEQTPDGFFTDEDKENFMNFIDLVTTALG